MALLLCSIHYALIGSIFLLKISDAFILRPVLTNYPLNNSEEENRTKFETYLRSERMFSVKNKVSIPVTVSDLQLPADIYIRNAQEKDLKSAAKILRDAFFNSNFFTGPVEWLKTYLSLQDSFSETSDIYLILVACKKSNDDVVGICEVDCRFSSDPKAAPRPYVCNLATDKIWRKQGIGKAFITVCEDITRDVWELDFLHLRVRRSNKPTIDWYDRLGYAIEIDTQPNDVFTGDEVILLKKALRKF